MSKLACPRCGTIHWAVLRHDCCNKCERENRRAVDAYLNEQLGPVHKLKLALFLVIALSGSALAVYGIHKNWGRLDCCSCTPASNQSQR